MFPELKTAIVPLALALASAMLGACDARSSADDPGEPVVDAANAGSGDRFTFGSTPVDAQTFSTGGEFTFGSGGGVTYSSTGATATSGSPDNLSTDPDPDPDPGAGTTPDAPPAASTPDGSPDGSPDTGDVIVFSDDPFDGYWEDADPQARERFVRRIVRTGEGRYDVDTFEDQGASGEPLNCFEAMASDPYLLDDRDVRFREVGETISREAAVAGDGAYPHFSHGADGDTLIRTDDGVDGGPDRTRGYVRTLEGVSAQDIPLCD